MRTLRQLAVLALLLAAPAFAQEESATEINKQLTNPVSELWSITFQQDNFRVDPGEGEGNRWSSNLPRIGGLPDLAVAVWLTSWPGAPARLQVWALIVP